MEAFKGKGDPLSSFENMCSTEY